MIIEIILVFISYFCLYFGYLIGKLSNDELKYKNYKYVYIWIFLLFIGICFSLNYFIAPLIIFICFLLFKTSYIWNLMYFFIGVSLVLSPYIDFTISLSCLFSLTFGAIIRTRVAYPNKGEKKAKNILKKSFAYMFLNSIGFFIGILVGLLIKFIF